MTYFQGSDDCCAVITVLATTSAAGQTSCLRIASSWDLAWEQSPCMLCLGHPGPRLPTTIIVGGSRRLVLTEYHRAGMVTNPYNLEITLLSIQEAHVHANHAIHKVLMVLSRHEDPPQQGGSQMPALRLPGPLA